MEHKIVITTTKLIPELAAVLPFGASAASPAGPSAVGPFAAPCGGEPAGESAVVAGASAAGALASVGASAAGALASVGALAEGAVAFGCASDGVGALPDFGGDAVGALLALGGAADGGFAGLVCGVGDEEGGLELIMAEGIIALLICTTDILYG